MISINEAVDTLLISVLGAIAIAFLKFSGSSILKNFSTKEDMQEIVDSVAKINAELVAKIAALELKIYQDQVNQLKECSSCRLHAETTKNDMLYSIKFNKDKM